MTEDEELTRTVDTYGTVSYRNSKGKLHRENGPAYVWTHGREEWWSNGKLHRVDGPAILDGGYTAWFLGGKLHRVDGPAVTCWGYQEWWLNGQRHRVGGPAVVFPDGREEWWFQGVLHREGGPAIVWPAGVHEEWWLNGKQVTDHPVLAQAWDEGYRATGYEPSHGENPYKPCTCCQQNPEMPDINHATP